MPPSVATAHSPETQPTACFSVHAAAYIAACLRQVVSVTAVLTYENRPTRMS